MTKSQHKSVESCLPVRPPPPPHTMQQCNNAKRKKTGCNKEYVGFVSILKNCIDSSIHISQRKCVSLI